MPNVLITTIYSTDSIVLAITKFSIDKLCLLVSDDSDQIQKEAIEKLKGTYSSVIKITETKIPLYDVVKITEKSVELIDSIPIDDKIILNITPARKTQSIGLLYAAFKRSSKIKKIIYSVEKTHELITIPLLEFQLTETQQDILENLKPGASIADLEKKVKQSRAMIYRNIKNLKHKGILEDEDELKITDFGKIAML